MTIQLKPRDIALLQMLEDGASSKEIGRRLDLTPGSARVYLCELYKKLKINNKTSAVAWFIHFKAGDPVATLSSTFTTTRDNKLLVGSLPALPRARFVGIDFGDVALQWGLLTALGGMSIYAGVEERRSQEDKPPQSRLSRLLWEWLLAGDFGAAGDYGLSLPKNEEKNMASFEIGLLGALLLLGGKAGNGKRLAANLAETSSSPESNVLSALSELLGNDKSAAWLELHRFATQQHISRPAKHLAMVILFHLYRKNGHLEYARATANAICAEFESVRDGLRDINLPNPASAIPELAQENMAVN